MKAYPLQSKQLGPLLLLILANGLILSPASPLGRYAAALILAAFLPGWVWLAALFPRPAGFGERVILAVGLSLGLTIIAAMAAVYWPGPIGRTKLIILTNLIVLAGLAFGWRRKWGAASSPAGPPALSGPFFGLPILILLLLLAAALRLPRLGYAEFHEDEAEALMLGVRLLTGEDYALFLHRKGPAQMLLPVSFWLLTGRLTETLARFPFALSSLLSVGVIFFVGRRWFNGPAGAVAALLWAINGYAIAFGRMVQYQALIFFLGPLALYCLYLAWAYRRPGWQIVGAILLAVCLLAHFDALLLLPAAGYLGWLGVSRGAGAWGSRGAETPGSRDAGTPGRRDAGGRASRVLTAVIALVLFSGLLASFYAPYVLDPEFSNTAAYLSESRVKPGLLYNNLALFQRLDKDYSSHFYLWLLLGGFVSFVLWQIRSVPKYGRWGVVGLGVLVLSTWRLPEMWRIGALDGAILPWLALFMLGFWLFSEPAVRAVWLLFGAAFIGYVFLVEDPRTHLYIVYPGAVLLAGGGWERFGAGVLRGRGAGAQRSRGAEKPEHTGAGAHRSRGAQKPGRTEAGAPGSEETEKPGSFPLLRSLGGLAAVSGGICLILAIVIYGAGIFLQRESALSRLRERWDGSTWALIYDDLPDAREYFGYPKREGWKAVGALRAVGYFPGDFRSVNEDFIVPIWYNYGQARSCYDAPAHFFVRTTGLETAFTPANYAETGLIEREQETRLRILSAGAEQPPETPTYRLDPLAAEFDHRATPQQFRRQAQPSHPVAAQFGPAIRFLGYDLATPQVAPGQTLRLDLYWQALDAPAADYRAFVHLTDGDRLWGQQDDNPACRLPASIWRPGQQGVGQFRLPIAPETPPGRYPLVIGLYHPETLERLPLTAGPGQPGDDFLWLGDIEVGDDIQEN